MVLILCSTPRRGVIAVVNCPNALPTVPKYKKSPGSRLLSERDMKSGATHEQACFPFAIYCRFDKTFFGVPKKCDYCQKVVYGTGFSCQNCRFHCHKRCVMVENEQKQPVLKQNICSLSRLPPMQPNDENIVKELMTSCKISNQLHMSIEDSHFMDHAYSSSNDRSLSPIATIKQAPASHEINTQSQPSSKVTVSQQNSESLTDDLSQIDQIKVAQSEPSTIDDQVPHTLMSHSGYSEGWNSLLQRLWDLVNLKRERNSILSNRSPEASTMSLASDLIDQAVTKNFHVHEDFDLKSGINSSSSPTKKAKSPQAKLAPLDIVFQNRNGSNTCSPQVRTPVDEFNSLVLEDLFSSEQKTCQQLQRKLQWVKHIVGDRGAYSEDYMTVNRPQIRAQQIETLNERTRSPKSRSGVIEDDPKLWLPFENRQCREKMSASWPLLGLHLNFEENDFSDDFFELDIDNGPKQSFGKEIENPQPIYNEMYSHTSELGEWTIPYSDLGFVECVSDSSAVQVFKGKWHGEVTIYQYDFAKQKAGDTEISEFLDQIRTFTKIRYENIALFMGASIELPLLAVVTSVRKGDSLFEAIRLKQRKLSHSAKICIARQIAQGMGYLHARGVILKTLTSKCVFLECKVKISMIDNGSISLWRQEPSKNLRTDLGCVSRGHLTYWSPELIRTLTVSPPRLTVDASKCTKESYVYAFGTVFYEMLASNHPFYGLAEEAVVWQIGSGKTQKLNSLISRSNFVKNLIESCWSSNPNNRPTFAGISKVLQHMVVIHKRNSSSVPDNLNRAGSNNQTMIQSGYFQ